MKAFLLLDDFPDALSDEMVFSLLVRYHLLSGNPNRSTSLGELFGDILRRTPVQASPAGLLQLAEVLPIGHGLRSSKRIALQHTSFSFHTRYFAREQTDEALDIYLNSGARGLRGTLGTPRIPISQDGFPPSYCDDCVVDDRKRRGVPHWRVSHQLPLVNRCHRHSTVLRLGCRHCGPLVADRFRLALPGDQCSCDEFEPLFKLGTGSDDFDRWMAASSYRALQEGRRRRPVAEGDLRSLAKEAGFGKRGGVDYPALADAMRLSIGGDLFDELGGRQPTSWLRTLLSPDEARKNTVRVLVLLYTLEKASENAARPPDPPDILASLPLGEIRRAYSRTQSIRDVANELGLPWKSVQAALIRQGVSVKTHSTAKHAVKRHEAITSILMSGGSIQESAQRVGISVTTIRNVLKANPALGNMLEQRAATEKRDRYRAQLLAAISVHRSRAEVVRADKATVSWLAAHDRQWLRDSLPVPAPRVGHSSSGARPSTRQNWSLIDLEWDRMIRDKAEELRAQTPPVFVSQSQVIQRLGIYARYYSHRHETPLAVKALADVVEARSVYHRRRLRWAIGQLSQNRARASWTDVCRTSGLDFKWLSEQRDLVIETAAESGLILNALIGSLHAPAPRQ